MVDVTTATAYTRLVDTLERHGSKVIANGVKAKAQCPGHTDRNPSLAITSIEGQALVYCHAGCATVDVLATLNLTMGDLFDEPAGARYDYTDHTGTVLRTVHRTPDKKFRQTGHTKGTAPLYRLPQVVGAVALGATVYVVEGEKDVHALESLGAVATCSPQGASNAAKADWSPLHGAHIIIIPDQDKAGKTYLNDVIAALDNKAATLQVKHPAAGCNDPADHIAAGHGLDELTETELPNPGADKDTTAGRTLTLTAASTIEVRPVHWLFDERIPLGEVTLLGGREGIGKSTAAYTFAADVTRGQLPGKYAGTPKSVIVVATEDSWAHTIAPRLIAAGADLDRVYRVDVTTPEGGDASVSLPHDLPALEDAVRQVDAALILLDPLMSRLAASLDTHKDAEVRRALEPLVAVAGRSGASVLGIIHVNKSHSTDPLTLLMGSRAFAAVSRAVLFVAADPDDDEIRLLGQAKNNLGRQDLPTLTFRIESAHIANTDEGPVWTSRLRWCGEREGSIRDVLQAADETPESRSAGDDAKDWMHDWLTSKGGSDLSATIKTEGAKAGHKPRRLHDARRKLKATVERDGFGGPTRWVGPTRAADPQSLHPPGESALNEIYATYATTGGPVVPVVPFVAYVQPPREGGTTANKSPDNHATSPADLAGTCPRCHQPNTPLTGHDRRGRLVCTDCTQLGAVTIT